MTGPGRFVTMTIAAGLVDDLRPRQGHFQPHSGLNALGVGRVS